SAAGQFTDRWAAGGVDGVDGTARSGRADCSRSRWQRIWRLVGAGSVLLDAGAAVYGGAPRLLATAGSDVGGDQAVYQATPSGDGERSDLVFPGGAIILPLSAQNFEKRPWRSGAAICGGYGRTVPGCRDRSGATG